MVAIPQGSQEVFVSFSAEINPNTIESLIAVMAECSNSGVRQVHLLLSTPGGDVRCGFNLYNVLRAMPFELITHNVGNVDSIGNVVFLAGMKRYAVSNATFMFHGVGFNVNNQRLEEKDVRERLDGILSDQRRMGDVITQHTGISQEEVASLFSQAQTRDAGYAIEKGIVDEVRDVQIPAGTPVLSLVFQRQGV